MPLFKRKSKKPTQNIQMATLLKTDQFMFVVAHSGRFSTVWDFEAYSEFLNLGGGSHLIGESCRKAFFACRTISNDKELLQFLEAENARERTIAWEAKTIDEYNYKSEKELYSKMLLVSAKVHNGHIEVLPNYRTKGGWAAHDVPKEDFITLPLTASETELGDGVLKAFEYCK